MYNGQHYPIIHILKGTILFTARKITPINEYTSFYYLYKLDKADPNTAGTTNVLDIYKQNDCEEVLTYFFPIPYMCDVVNNEFTCMNGVVLTQDVKLLCLISPSPFIRGDKNSKFGQQLKIGKCSSRDYDICISNEVIDALKLNGYIGIAGLDSLSAWYDRMVKLFGTEATLQNSLLYKSACFNNYNHKNKLDTTLPTFAEFATQRNRIFGTPEITLIPYNIHRADAVTKYKHVHASFKYNLRNKNRIQARDYEPFVFKPFIKSSVPSISNTAAFDMARELINLIDRNVYIKKSLQSYPLFNIHTQDADPAIVRKYAIEYIERGHINVPAQKMFLSTYNDNDYRDLENDLSAFEVIYTYTGPQMIGIYGGNSTKRLSVNSTGFPSRSFAYKSRTRKSFKPKSWSLSSKKSIRSRPYSIMTKTKKNTALNVTKRKSKTAWAPPSTLSIISPNKDFIYHETSNGIPLLFMNYK